MDKWKDQRMELLEAIGQVDSLGLVSGSSGNFSVSLERDRADGYIMITPSQVPYSIMKASDLMVVDLHGNILHGDLTLSTETPMHLALYKHSPDIKAVIHTHSVYASALAVSGLDLPPIIDELIVTVGGAVKVSDYGLPGSAELAINVCNALEDRRAVLIRNHGLIGVGKNISEAVNVCRLVERVCQVYVLANSLGNVNILPGDIVKLERALFLNNLHE